MFADFVTSINNISNIHDVPLVKGLNMIVRV